MPYHLHRFTRPDSAARPGRPTRQPDLKRFETSRPEARRPMGKQPTGGG